MNYDDIVSNYDSKVGELTARYESLQFESVHRQLIPHIPTEAAAILDIGSGSGRDAAWFAERGHDVIAVEPSESMLAQAKSLHPSPRIQWLQDSLPDLRRTMRLGLTFDFILLSAVWMHIAPADRARVFRKLSTLLKPGGAIAISLRHGPHHIADSTYPVSSLEIEQLAIRRGLTFSLLAPSEDQLKQPGVEWETVLLKFPEDGTGALPLLRNVIINDAKSSTYKLALLRTLVRVADSASGLAKIVSDEHVTVPLGLVALYWIRIYKPLIENAIPQMPANKDNRGLAFVGDAFRQLVNVSPFELRVGQVFHGGTANALVQALKDAVQTIRKMPAHYITFPNSNEQIFKVAGKIKTASSAESSLIINDEFLWSFGEMQVPTNLWRAFSSYAPWIEPALLFEWSELMKQYGESRGQPVNFNDLMLHLKWLDPARDTALVRGLVLQMMQQNAHQVQCVWSGKMLRADRFDVDHCFPFAAWPCNDLWNLLPANKEVNNQKRDKLVTVATINESRDRIESFWTGAYFAEPISYEGRFRREALASLPALESSSGEQFFECLFEAMLVKRMRLRCDHNLAEWEL